MSEKRASLAQVLMVDYRTGCAKRAQIPAGASVAEALQHALGPLCHELRIDVTSNNNRKPLKDRDPVDPTDTLFLYYTAKSKNPAVVLAPLPFNDEADSGTTSAHLNRARELLHVAREDYVKRLKADCEALQDLLTHSNSVVEDLSARLQVARSAMRNVHLIEDSTRTLDDRAGEHFAAELERAKCVVSHAKDALPAMQSRSAALEARLIKSHDEVYRDNTDALTKTKEFVALVFAVRKDVLAHRDAVQSAGEALKRKITAAENLSAVYPKALDIARQRYLVNRAAARLRNSLMGEVEGIRMQVEKLKADFGSQIPTNLIPGLMDPIVLPECKDVAADFVAPYQVNDLSSDAVAAILNKLVAGEDTSDAQELKNQLEEERVSSQHLQEKVETLQKAVELTRSSTEQKAMDEVRKLEAQLKECQQACASAVSELKREQARAASLQDELKALKARVHDKEAAKPEEAVAERRPGALDAPGDTISSDVLGEIAALRVGLGEATALNAQLKRALAHSINIEKEVVGKRIAFSKSGGSYTAAFPLRLEMSPESIRSRQSRWMKDQELCTVIEVDEPRNNVCLCTCAFEQTAQAKPAP